MSCKTILSVAVATALSLTASAQAQGLPVQQIQGGAGSVYADVTVASGPTVNLAQLAQGQMAQGQAAQGPFAMGFSGPTQPVYGAANLTPGAPVALQSMDPVGQGYGQSYGQGYGQNYH